MGRQSYQNRHAKTIQYLSGGNFHGDLTLYLDQYREIFRSFSFGVRDHMEKKSDRASLLALLEVRHLLTDKEGIAFSDMLEKSESSGKSLTAAQRSWVDAKIKELSLKSQEYQSKLKLKPGEVHPFDLLDRPKKPPTKRT